MEKTTLNNFLNQLKGNDWYCHYSVTYYRADKSSVTRSGNAKLINYDSNLLIRWDNEFILENAFGQIPVLSFPLYHEVEYDPNNVKYGVLSFTIKKTPEWKITFSF